MNKKIKDALKLIVFLSIGIFLFWWVYRNQPLDKIGEALKSANYSWIALSLFLGLLSHVSRAMRWNMLLKPLGHKPPLSTTFFAVMIGYLANLAIPRLGEITRCGIVSRYEKFPISKVLGTVLLDRLFDVVMLLVMLGIVLATQLQVILDFFQENPYLYDKIESLRSSTWLLVVLTVLFTSVMAAVFYYRQRLLKFVLFAKVYHAVKGFWEGIKTIQSLERKAEFIAHSIFIWMMYFLMIYICFFSFPETSDLGVLAGLTVFVMSAFGMSAPVQGGIGAWHFMVIATLLIYKVPETEASAFAFLVHGATTLFMVVAGVISLVLLPLTRKTEPGNPNYSA